MGAVCGADQGSWSSQGFLFFFFETNLAKAESLYAHLKRALCLSADVSFPV